MHRRDRLQVHEFGGNQRVLLEDSAAPHGLRQAKSREREVQKGNFLHCLTPKFSCKGRR